MQVNNNGRGQTIFAINHWKQDSNADVGIGSSEGNTRDGTFKGNADTYSSKGLRVYVRPK